MTVLVMVGKKGRIVIPKEIRDTLNIKEGTLLKIYIEGNRLIVEPIEDIVEKFKGSVKVDKWPEDLDEFLFEVLGNWLRGT